MNEVSLIIVLILTIYAGIAVLDQISIQIGLYSPLFAGTITGLLLGDLSTGLAVGATMQLMSLGIATFGGASVADFLTGTIVGSAYSIISGQGPEFGIPIGAAIGTLLIQLDVLGRTTNIIFQHKADKCAENGDAKGIEISNILGTIPWMITRMIPVFVALWFGKDVVDLITTKIPSPIIDGLKYAGGLLPAMGLALLMRYLPVKKFFPYYIIGFVVMAYASSLFNIMGISLLGLAMAALYYKNNLNVALTENKVSSDMEVEIDE